MKTILKISILPVLLLALASAAYASPVYIGSFGTNLNSTGFTESGLINTALDYQGYTATLMAVGPFAFGASYDVLPETPTWEAALPGTSWVSNSANGGPPSGDSGDATLGYYYYDTTFTTSTMDTGTLKVDADDTAEVILNGAIIVNFDSLGSDSHCAQGSSGPNCSSEYEVNIATVAGSNNLEIIDWQSDAATPAGVDFASGPLTATPEPSSLLLLGTGLLGLALVAFRKAKPARPVLHLNM